MGNVGKSHLDRVRRLEARAEEWIVTEEIEEVSQQGREPHSEIPTFLIWYSSNSPL